MRLSTNVQSSYFYIFVFNFAVGSSIELQRYAPTENLLNHYVRCVLQNHGSEHSIHGGALGGFREEYLLSSERKHSHP